MAYDIHPTRGWEKPHPEGIKIHYAKGDYTASVIWNGELGFEAFVYRPSGDMVLGPRRFTTQLFAQVWAEEEIAGAIAEYTKTVDQQIAANSSWGSF